MQNTDTFINNDMAVQLEIRDTFILTAEMFAYITCRHHWAYLFILYIQVYIYEELFSKTL